MKRVVWLLLVALVLYVFGSAAWKAAQRAMTPQHQAHPEL